MVQRFRKKPIEIEAVQFTDDKDDDNLMELADFIDNQDLIISYENGSNAPLLKIKTLEDANGSVHYASIGDWIIKGVNGEFYPCKPDIFEKTYEPVSEMHNVTTLEIGDELGLEDGEFLIPYKVICNNKKKIEISPIKFSLNYNNEPIENGIYEDKKISFIKIN